MERVAAGKITRAFGKEGEVKAVLYDTFPANYDTREPLYVYMDGLAVPLFISRLERRGKSGAVMVFDDIDTEGRTVFLTGLEFFILPELATEIAPGEGLEEFIGFTAILTEEGSDKPECTGIITSIDGNTSNPLFNIRNEGEEILVPATEDFITAVDPHKRIIRIQTPPGLLEL